MARKCLKRRQTRREELISKHQKKRESLKVIMNSQTASLEEKELALLAYSKLPKDSSAVRHRNRCAITGRGRGVYRKFGMCRNMIRVYAMLGYIPGLHKASW